MVLLDHQLIYAAHRLLNGANVHHLRGLIFAYQLAVDLCNRYGPKHETYRIQSEVDLRNYIHECQAEITRGRTGDPECK
jgi:hypothetical protein